MPKGNELSTKFAFVCAERGGGVQARGHRHSQANVAAFGEHFVSQADDNIL